MKKIKMLALVAICFFAASYSAEAQTKIGYIDAETLVYLMPEARKIDSLVRQYQVDTIGREYQRLMENYQYKDSMLKDDDAKGKKMVASVRQQYEKDVADLMSTLQGWQQIAQEATQNKQNELLAPVMKKISDAINAVAKEKGYTHVMARETFIVAPDGDNLLMPVAAKLKVTVPPQLQPGYKEPAKPAAGR